MEPKEAIQVAKDALHEYFEPESGVSQIRVEEVIEHSSIIGWRIVLSWIEKTYRGYEKVTRPFLVWNGFLGNLVDYEQEISREVVLPSKMGRWWWNWCRWWS